jgi:hypothetical protein
VGASEDRAQRREQERQIAAWEVEEIMIPGHGIWTRDAIKALLDGRQAKLDHQGMEERALHEREEAARLHDTDPGRWSESASPRRMRRDLDRDREEGLYR